MNMKVSDSLGETGSQTSQKRILHFSDGTLEVDDDEDCEKAQVDNSQNSIDPKKLDWMPWMWYQTTAAGTKTLQVCDYLGESLASFFGITTPKYRFEINEFYRMKKAEEEAQKEKDLELGGWTNKTQGDLEKKDTVLTEPNKIKSDSLISSTDGDKTLPSTASIPKY